MSGSEVLIYGYGAVCLCMIVFNLVYNAVQRGKEPRIEKKVEHLKTALLQKYGAADATRASEDPAAVPDTSVFFRQMHLKPEKSEDLLVLAETLSDIFDSEHREAGVRFIRKLQPDFLRLAKEYLKKDSMQTAYFAAFLQEYVPWTEYSDDLLEVLLEYAAKQNMYCRINALDALYASGNAPYVVKALNIQDRMETLLHTRVLTEGLLSFSGNHEELMKMLLERFGEFSVRIRLAVLNYIRFQSGEYKEFMYRIMTDEQEDRELRLSAERYFGRYPWEQARDALLAFARDKETLRWEYAAVAAAALKDYKGEDVISALKSALYSSNWYVRYNAAVSLEASGFSYTELIDVMAGKDRYAREMMEYRLGEQRLMENQKVSKEGRGEA